MPQQPPHTPANVALIPAAPWLIPDVAPQLRTEQPQVLAEVSETVRWLLERSTSIELLIATPGTIGGTAGGVLEVADLPERRWGRHPYRRAGAFQHDADAVRGNSGSGTAEGGDNERRATDGTADQATPAPADPAAAGWWVGRTLLAGAASQPPTGTVPDRSTPITTGGAGSGADPGALGVLVLADGALAHPGGPLAPAPEQRHELAAAAMAAEQCDLRWQTAALSGEPDRWRAQPGRPADAMGASLPCGLRALGQRLGPSQRWCAAGGFLGAPYGVGYHVYRWWR